MSENVKKPFFKRILTIILALSLVFVIICSMCSFSPPEDEILFTYDLDRRGVTGTSKVEYYNFDSETAYSVVNLDLPSLVVGGSYFVQLSFGDEILWSGVCVPASSSFGGVSGTFLYGPFDSQYLSFMFVQDVVASDGSSGHVINLILRKSTSGYSVDDSIFYALNVLNIFGGGNAPYNPITITVYNEGVVPPEPYDVWDVFSDMSSWIPGAITSMLNLFWFENKLTVVGILSVAALGISVVFLIIYAVISRFLRFRG